MTNMLEIVELFTQQQVVACITYLFNDVGWVPTARTRFLPASA